jgi:hypothetical protein
VVDEATARLRDQALRVETVGTESEADMLTAWPRPMARRVVLVGGDGSLDAPASAAHSCRISR